VNGLTKPAELTALKMYRGELTPKKSLTNQEHVSVKPDVDGFNSHVSDKNLVVQVNHALI
jgi:hypothetical protein